MRFLLTLALLASCAPAPPPHAEGDSELRLADMTYHCSTDGYEYVRIQLRNGSVEESNTGERCDYEAWEEDERINGPVYSRRSRRPSYEEWLRRNRPEG